MHFGLNLYSVGRRGDESSRHKVHYAKHRSETHRPKQVILEWNLASTRPFVVIECNDEDEQLGRDRTKCPIEISSKTAVGEVFLGLRDLICR